MVNYYEIESFIDSNVVCPFVTVVWSGSFGKLGQKYDRNNFVYEISLKSD